MSMASGCRKWLLLPLEGLCGHQRKVLLLRDLAPVLLQQCMRPYWKMLFILLRLSESAYRLDGSKIIKIFLDPKGRNDTEYKLETFAGVYGKLSGKDVVFEYPITEA